MTKPYFLIGLAALTLGLAATDLTSAQAATWHSGTPKALRHTWFYNGRGNNKAYITYSKTKSTGNLFGLDATSKRYYRLPGYGLKKLRYQALGHGVYRLSGVQYSPKGSRVQFDGQRMTYKIKLQKKHIHFYKGYANYGRKTTFPTMKTPAIF
ncbi:hypothetical protein [Levilactobacillus tujiorum]|uniref:hypothetical protein n=1 Tax=Levilactobacillus tujiorum TaxID=2912243 RepID=UPI001456C636|nr:hypothetical protein [Levilactobacillus tujiorum]NLR31752.1 hypothetical protein [Levilactobacillus tujiorum]